MKINKASAELFQKCASGEHLKSAELICRKAGKEQQEFLKIKMTDLLVSSFQTGGSGHADIVPTDQISLNFSKIEYKYAGQKADGTLDGYVAKGYDLKQQKVA
jgi:type VI secretion system secreted protein Hcp